MRKILTYIATLLILFGILGFLFNTLLLSHGGITFKGELPLTNVQGIIEKNKKIYIGLGEYDRIQVYTLDGKYLDYYKTSNYSKAFDFSIDEIGDPIVNVIYTRDKPVEKYIQEDQSEYKIISRFPITVEKKHSNKKHIIIKQPLHMSFWGGSINCWLIGVIGVFLFFIINSWIIMEVQGLQISKEKKSLETFKRIFK